MRTHLHTGMKCLLSLAGVLITSTCLPLQAASDINGYYSVGYMPSWQGEVNSINYDKLTHINYAFALSDVSGNISVENISKLQSLVSQAHAKNIKVLISVGGWTGREDLGTAIHNASSTLVDNLVKFMQDYQLDGVDIDWEYPDDATIFAFFMKNLGSRVHGQGKLLTAALSASDWGGGKVNSDALAAMDFATIMAYDDNGDQHSSYALAQSATNYWKGKGLSKSKLILGVPFYGYKGSDRSVGYAFRDILAADPGAANKDSSNGVSYNGIPTIQQKTQLAMDNGQGVMNWELSQDATGESSLLNAIYTKLSGGQNTTFTITANAGSGGTITPSGAIKVNQGADQTFNISPASGYEVASVTVDGSNVGAVPSYTFSKVEGAHTIQASFSTSNGQGQSWAAGVFYPVGASVTYGGRNWKNTYAHTSQADWYPGAPGLWFWVAQ